MSLVITDTSPLNYLIQIGRVSLLPALFGKIYAPPVVIQELMSAGAPRVVRQWASILPSWIEVRSPLAFIPPARGLGAGEHAAISLAVELRADLILLDDGMARRAAAAFNIPLVGTLGVFYAAAKRKILDKQEAEAAIIALTRTNKRIDPRIVSEVLQSILALQDK